MRGGGPPSLGHALGQPGPGDHRRPRQPPGDRRQPGDPGHGGVELAVGHVVIAGEVALADPTAGLGRQVAGRDVVDVDGAEAAGRVARDPPRQRLDDEAPGRGRRAIAGAERKRRAHDHHRQAGGGGAPGLELGQVLRAHVRIGLAPVGPRQGLVGEVPRRWHADRGDRAGVDDAAHAGRRRRRQDVARAVDVDGVDARRIAQPQAVDGRQVIDHVAPVDRARDRRWVTDVDRDPLDVEAEEVVGSLAGGEPGPHRPPLGDQGSHHRRADEATSASDEGRHPPSKYHRRPGGFDREELILHV
jgi:hypothetical protein